MFDSYESASFVSALFFTIVAIMIIGTAGGIVGTHSRESNRKAGISIGIRTGIITLSISWALDLILFIGFDFILSDHFDWEAFIVLPFTPVLVISAVIGMIVTAKFVRRTKR